MALENVVPYKPGALKIFKNGPKKGPKMKSRFCFCFCFCLLQLLNFNKIKIWISVFFLSKICTSTIKISKT